jgi:hypothetical protein
MSDLTSWYEKIAIEQYDTGQDPPDLKKIDVLGETEGRGAQGVDVRPSGAWVLARVWVDKPWPDENPTMAALHEEAVNMRRRSFLGKGQPC